MSEQININFMDIMRALLCDYESTCGVKPFDGNIIISEDMRSSYIQLRSDLVEKGVIPIDDLEKYHGLTVQPAETDGIFTILLNKKFILESFSKNNVDWVGTLVHEAVHVNDFRDYFNLVSPSSYDELYDYNLHRMFIYWTEFHARAIGHYFLRKYSLEDFTSSTHLDYLLNEALPFHINDMAAQVNATNNPDDQMYTIVHFLGRLAVWQYLYPDTFCSDFINKLLGANPWMEDLYYFFIKYETLEEIYPHFDEIEAMLDRNL
ncbi:MAG: hypothetical protein E7547_10420 [Ruminococcaceae bacterium]|nr:hypothetical protein [Oscillospiraceae bacterium]